MTIEKSLDMSLLLEFYGQMLTPRQRDIADLYYNDDLSLSEISDNIGITRQGVRDGLRKAEEIMNDAESKLHLVSSWKERDELVSLIQTRLKEIGVDDEKVMKALSDIRG